MTPSFIPWILSTLLILASIGVILAKKPVHSGLFFLLTLMMLSSLYLQLSAQFIAVMQVLVYAGAILVIFMFVIILFQDAHQQIAQLEAKSAPLLLITAAVGFVLTLLFLGKNLLRLPPSQGELTPDYGTVESLGKALYLDFFFPFEAVILLFLVAVIGAVYIGKKDKLDATTKM